MIKSRQKKGAEQNILHRILLFIFAFFPLFIFPSVLFNTEECNDSSNFIRLFCPSAGKRQTFHCFRHKVNLKNLPEIFIDIPAYFRTFYEYFLAVISFYVSVPKNFCTSAFVLVLVNAFLVGAEGYLEFFSSTFLLSSSSNFLTISSVSSLNSEGASISSFALLMECSVPLSSA